MEMAQAQIEQLIKEERWEEALVVCRIIADELHEDPRWLWRVLQHLRLDAEQLRAEDTGSSLWLLGHMHYLTRQVGPRRVPPAAWPAGGMQGRPAQTFHLDKTQILLPVAFPNSCAARSPSTGEYMASFPGNMWELTPNTTFLPLFVTLMLRLVTQGPPEAPSDSLDGICIVLEPPSELGL